MSGRSEKLGERIRDLTVRFGAESMRSLQRYNELLQRAAAGDLDESAVGGAYLQFVRDETERYFRNVADVSSGYYTALLELGSIYNPPFFEQAFNRRPRANQATSRQGGDVIELRGSLGDEAVSTFRVDNAGSNSDEVSFVVSEFTGPPGSAPFRPPLRLQPPRFVLERSESQLVSVSLPLVAGLFVPNQRYTARLSVQKRDAFDLTIDVVVTAPSGQRPTGMVLDEPII
jgi:hypothetical protein